MTASSGRNVQAFLRKDCATVLLGAVLRYAFIAMSRLVLPSNKVSSIEIL